MIPGRPADPPQVSSVIALHIDAAPTAWLRLSLGYFVARRVMDASGAYGNPLWAPGGWSRLFLAAAFVIEPTPPHR